MRKRLNNNNVGTFDTSCFVGNNTNGFFNKAKHVFTSLLFASFYLFNLTSFSSVSVVVILLLILLSSLLERDFFVSFKTTHTLIIPLLFSVFCLASSYWAIKSPSASIEKGVTILENIFCVYILSICYIYEKRITSLLKSVMWAGVVVAIYIIIGDANGIINSLWSGSRYATDFANANAVGMLMAESITIFVFFSLIFKFKLCYVMSILPLTVLIATQSKTALLETILGVFLVWLYWIFSNKYSHTKSKKITISILVVLICSLFLIRSNFLDGFFNRFDTMMIAFQDISSSDGSSRVRFEMINYGWSLFKSHPLLGVGISNAGIGYEGFSHDTYLHNNYIEMLANGGIVGFSLYYLSHTYSLYTLFKTKEFKKPMGYITFCLLAMILLADFGTVSYYSKGTFFVFTIIFLQIYFNNDFRKWKKVGLN